MTDKLLSAKEVAAYLDVSVKTVRRYVGKKLLKAYRLTESRRGRSEYRFKPADVEALLK